MKTFGVAATFLTLGLLIDGFTGNFTNTGNKVTVNYYYESLCPDCIQFDNEQLCPAWKKFGTHFTVEFVPYGNAETRTDPVTGKVTIQCQHGQDECVGNILHACALKYFPASATDFICCTMEQDNPPAAGPKCAKQLGLDFTRVKKCMNSQEGFNLLKAYGDKTDKLDPPHQYVPWILFNGQYNEDDMGHAQENIIQVICKYLQHPLPRECNEI